MPGKPRGKGANGQGGVSRYRDGRWVARLTVEIAGEKKRLVAYAPTKAEALRKLDELRARRVRGESVAPDLVTVAQLLETYLVVKEASGLRAATLYSYRRHAAHYLAQLGGVRVQALTTAHIQAHYAFLLRQGKTKANAGRPGRPGLAPKSIRHVHAVLSGALELARRNKVILANPAKDVQVPRPGGDRPAVVILDEAQLGVLADVALDEGPGAGAYRLGAFWLLLVESGARQSELLGLQWPDVDWARRTVRIARSLSRHSRELTDTKNEGSKRVLRVSAEALLALRAHRVRQDADREAAGDAYRHDLDLIFARPTGEPLVARTVALRFKALLRRAGLPEGAHLHGVRHSVASALLTNGVDAPSVGKLLGHASPAVTLSVYAHVLRRPQDAASTRLQELLRGGRDRGPRTGTEGGRGAASS